MKITLSSETIKKVAREVGFDLCGIAPCRAFDEERRFLEAWISDGNASTLDYLTRNIDKRADASLLVEGTRSVVVCGVSYRNKISVGYAPDSTTKIASYACTEDYHTTIKAMLRAMVEHLKQEYPTLSAAIFTDTAPIFEKRYAVEAGLGWIGRQSLLVTPQYGTFVLLGEILLGEECDSYDTPLEGRGCGECRRCVEVCPNRAIDERHIDTRRCISRATIERSDEDETLPLHGWIFGCDECQSCCPYNRTTAAPSNPRFAPLFDPRTMDAAWWRALDKSLFKAQFKRTPLSRSSLERILKNIERNEKTRL